MKKIYLILLTLIISCLMISSVFAQNKQCYSWYCKRNTDHRQPLVDSDMQFIEDYGCYYVDRKSSDKKVVYLTFDVGYENGNVKKTLDILKQEGVSGNFFILKNFLLKNTDLVKRMIGENHLVGNHTATHPDTSLLIFSELKKELDEMEGLYCELTGEKLSKYFRPPEGRFSKESLINASKLGYKTILWSFAYADWDNNAQMDNDKAYNKIISNIHNGAIILLHPTSNTNAEILQRVIKELKNNGYTFETLDNL